MAQGILSPLTGQRATYRHQALAAPAILDGETLVPSHVAAVVAQHGLQGRDRLFASCHAGDVCVTSPLARWLLPRGAQSGPPLAHRQRPSTLLAPYWQLL